MNIYEGKILTVARRFFKFHLNYFVGLALLFTQTALAGNSGPLAKFNTTQPYLIYYGNWTAAQVDYARTNFQLVILHPVSNITSNQIATIKRGKDNLAGTADDVKVLAYLSIGEDDQNGAPVAGDRLGPRVDPRTSDSLSLSTITNTLGLPSTGGTNYASYYLNSKSNQTGVPDQNSNFGSYFVNAGAPAWWNMLQTMSKSANGQSGMQEILTTNYGNSLNCDGLFLDTVDTAAPDAWGTPYEWTSPGMQAFIGRIHTNYPSKLLMANRGLFYFDPNLKTYAYNIRPYVDMVMFESYYSDTSTNLVSPYFADNKYDLAPKLNAEAGRPDGFNVFVVDYDHTPPQPAATVNQDYVESMGVQGWPLFRTNPSLNETLNTNSTVWLATNVDVLPPVWDSTTANGPTLPAPRVGLQEVVASNGVVTVYWDVARDQTGPVHYNVYYSIGGTVNFATASKLTHVVPGIPTNYNYPTGTGPGIYPYCYTVTGLSNGMTYSFAIRAEDSCSPAHEDTNTTFITVVTGITNTLGTYRTIIVDGNFSDWAGVPWSYQGWADGNVVNYLQVQFANDTNYIYGHVRLASPYALFQDYYSHLFFDTDVNALTGYSVGGALFGSEIMIESGFGYDQRNGSFNAGSISSLGWAVAPTVSASEFEFRVSLAATYPDTTPLFGTNSFRILLQDNRGEVTIATGLLYALAAAPPPVYSHIAVDGNFNDWANVPIITTVISNSAALSFATGSIANDNDYLYLRFSLYSPASPFSDANTHFFIDTDNNVATGYHPSGITLGSELAVESGIGYDERSGIFAGTSVSGLDWALAPAVAGTNFELRISRLARYADNSLIFTNPTINFVLQDNRGSVMMFPPYTFSSGGPYENWRAFYFTPAQLTNSNISGDRADASGDHIPNLVKYAFNLNPLTFNAANNTNLPQGLLESFGGTNYFDVRFTQLNPPAGVQYIPQVSTNLLAWDSATANFLQVSSVVSATNTSVVTMRLLGSVNAVPQRFVRIAVQKL